MIFLDIFHGSYKDIKSVTLCVSGLTVKAKFSDLCLILSHGPPLYIESRIATASKDLERRLARLVKTVSRNLHNYL